MKRKINKVSSLEVSNSCNLKCLGCIGWIEKKGGLVQPETVNKAIDLFKRIKTNTVQLYWRGEPCTHPQLPQIAKQMHDNGFKTIVCTNGLTKYNQDKEY